MAAAESGDNDDAVVVPDDASELDADRLAWLAEQRRLRRRARARRLIFTRRWDRFGLSGPLVVICLLATAAVGALAVIFIPNPGSPPGPAPLSSAAPLDVPTRPSGSAEAPEGRRLPEVTLAGDAGPVAAADLRPAVLALAPPDCSCAAMLTQLLRQAQEFRIRLWIIGAGSARRTEAVRLDETTGSGTARWAVDPDGALVRTLEARGLSVVLVSDAGEIRKVVRDVPLDPDRVPSLEPVLALLVARRS